MKKEEALSILIQVANSQLSKIASEHQLIQSAVKVVMDDMSVDMIEDEKPAVTTP